MTSFAQKSIVLESFKKYGIDPGLLDPKSRDRPDNYTFDYKYTSVSSNKETVTIAKYDPSKEEQERWTVISVKGKAASASDIKAFRKNHSKPPVTATTDESTYTIEKVTADFLVISYKQDPASMPAEAQFMKDCRLYMTINLKTKRLEKLQSLNEKPLKIKIFKAEKLDLVVKYTYDEQEKRYFTESEDLNLMVKFLGQLAPMETISAYSNYKKI
jgi:acetylornithine deacetylase/succinyl-diaminopimelate desuccinylase-like protein